MNVTKQKYKGRKFHNENCPQKVAAEQRGYAGVPASVRIAETSDIITDLPTDSLLKRIISRDNMNTAYFKVKSNRGAGGVDKMSVDELLPYLREHRLSLLQQIRDGKYKPNPVRRVEIPKEERGKTRKLGIPTVVDRVIQQAIAQILTPIYEPQFSEASFGFRPKRGAHDALKTCQRYADEGYVYVVDMDLEKFFDTVCQSKLIEILSRSIKDGRVISLIHKYLNAGVIRQGVFERSEQGVPQGGPLSPLLSNVMLNELDKELERRGHKFVRYADDCMILCKSRRSAERTLASIIPFIEKKLFLKVNREKTSVAHISKVKYLGYGFYRYKGKCRFKVHKKSLAKMKKRLRAITNRSKAISNEERPLILKRFVKGWVNYFKLADMKNMLRQLDEWLWRRIRAIYWKQWKKVKTRCRMIRRYNLPDWKVHELANCRKGIWRAALMLNQILTNKEIARQGYISLTSYYEQVCEN
ncbi:MAG: group II intron reverse transcriptase/maturase [Selenomonas ruminantium]|uniref:Group II intron reverse transcriptase/maturase n=1 Tax=Selenomonas ruminantium TaxID=971 RepID=A0A927WKR9_SELRU|nr:group II intron reverse transcriptase/maturase [Selenomonas ruminantium]MBE6085774.1 group II intron reverse transcriptase/maturase [Selenomonas ruminantium]